MSDRYDFWTHGVNTQIEYPRRLSGDPSHSGLGTQVEQSPEQSPTNWFHIAVPTPTWIEDVCVVNLRYVKVMASVNENARVDEIHLRDAGQLIQAYPLMLTDREISTDLYLDSPRQITGGLSVSIHVTFLTGAPIGRILLKGAGAYFEA